MWLLEPQVSRGLVIKCSQFLLCLPRPGIYLLLWSQELTEVRHGGWGSGAVVRETSVGGSEVPVCASLPEPEMASSEM